LSRVISALPLDQIIEGGQLIASDEEIHLNSATIAGRHPSFPPHSIGHVSFGLLK